MASNVDSNCKSASFGPNAKQAIETHIFQAADFALKINATESLSHRLLLFIYDVINFRLIEISVHLGKQKYKQTN